MTHLSLIHVLSTHVEFDWKCTFPCTLARLDANVFLVVNRGYPWHSCHFDGLRFSRDLIPKIMYFLRGISRHSATTPLEVSSFWAEAPWLDLPSPFYRHRYNANLGHQGWTEVRELSQATYTLVQVWVVAQDLRLWESQVLLCTYTRVILSNILKVLTSSSKNLELSKCIANSLLDKY